MMISEGNGMHADSIAISSTTTPYPIAEMVATMKWESMVMIFAIIANDRTNRAVRLTVQKHNLRDLLLSVHAQFLQRVSVVGSHATRPPALPNARYAL